jgi:hypothetical protein
MQLGQALQGLGHLALAVVPEVEAEGEGGADLVAVVVINRRVIATGLMRSQAGRTDESAVDGDFSPGDRFDTRPGGPTMCRLIVSNIMSLDGYIEGPHGNVTALPMDGFFDQTKLERLRAAARCCSAPRPTRGSRDTGLLWPPTPGCPRR